MIIAVLLFPILFINIYVGIWCNQKFLSGDIKDSSTCVKFLVSAVTAGLLCPFYADSLFVVLAALVLPSAITILTIILYRPDKKLLLFYTCSWLGILFFVDTLMYLILIRYCTLSPEIWLTVLLFYRIILYLTVLKTPVFINRIQKYSPYYGSIYGTALVGFAGSLFLSYITVSTDHLSYLSMIWMVLVVVFFLRLLLATSHMKYLHEKELLSIIELKNALLERNYTAVNRAYSVNGKLFHDFHRHLELLRQLAAENGYSEILDYIEQLNGPLQEIANIVWTGDKTLDYIINSRYTQAKEHDISMELNIEFPYNTNILSNDLCTILSNLLDNAIEAASVPTLSGTRKIYLTIRRIHNMLIIKSENSSLPPVYTSDGSLDTLKENSFLHGFGMKNIEIAVQKYDGVVQSSYDDGIFQTIVTLSFDGVRIE